MSLSNNTTPVLDHEPHANPKSNPNSPPDPRCDFHPHSTNQNYTYVRPRDGFYKRLIIACDGTWQRAGYSETKETSLFGGTTDVFPSNVARLGWLVDTSCPDQQYGSVSVGMESTVKASIAVSEAGVTSAAGVAEAEVGVTSAAELVEGEAAEIPRAVQQVVYYQAGVGSRGSWLPRTLDGKYSRSIPPKTPC